MNNTTIIIPIHEFNDEISNYLGKAIESIEKQKSIDVLPEIIIVFPVSIENEISTFVKTLSERDDNKLKFNLIKNENNSDYQSQINLAVKSVNTNYFSVLEFDDEYGLSHFKNLDKYIKAYPNIDIFLNLMVEVDTQNRGIKYTNEVVWAQQFAGENGEIGYLNLNALKQFTDFKLSGAVIKKSEFESIGGYKSNIKLTFMYEFLLRALNNGNVVYTIPRIGYKHLSNRENSLFDTYMKSMSPQEKRFWFNVAIKESNFMNDREIDTTKMNKLVVVK